MEFNETTRKLTSSTGYIKRISTGEVFCDIWLGKSDSPDNYAEATEQEREEYLKTAYPEDPGFDPGAMPGEAETEMEPIERVEAIEDGD